MAEQILRRLLREAGLTQAELAEMLDVSVQTVTNWCTGRNHVRLNRLGPLTQVLQERSIPSDSLTALIREELGNQGIPSSLLEQLIGTRQASSPTVAMIAWNAATPGVEAALATFRKLLSRSGVGCVIMDCMRDQAVKRSAFELLESHPFAGVTIWAPLDGIQPLGEFVRLAEKLHRQGTQTVVIGEVADHLPPYVASVTWDAVSLSYEATRLLIRTQPEPIGGIFYGLSESYHSRNFEGFERAVEEARLPLSEEMIIWKVGPETLSRPSITHDMGLLSKRTATIFVDSQEVWPELWTAFQELKLSSARKFDLSVLAYPAVPPLPFPGMRSVTCVSLPFVDICRLVADLMAQLIRHGRDTEEPIRLQYQGQPEVRVVNGPTIVRR